MVECNGLATVSAGPQAGAQYVPPAPSAPFAPAHYFGWTDGALDWTSLAWADINAVLALVDSFAVGIVRAGSTFTFARPGVYVATLAVNIGTLSTNIGFRWRTAAPVTESAFAAWGGSAPDTPMVTFQAALSIAAAGETRTLQYCREGGAGGNFGAITLDGEVCSTARLNIVQVSP